MIHSPHTPCLLTPADAAAYVALRREMLLDAPWSFLSSPGDDMAGDIDKASGMLGETENEVLAIAAAPPAGDGRLLATAGVVRMKRPKIRHRALIWGVYTTPSERGRGLGAAVVGAAIDTARTWPGVTVIFLAASVNAPGAVRLYERLGFVRWGVEPDAIRVDGRAFDEVHLAMRL